jgi:inosine-uridine nucleoside N-ribohydrolase
MSQNIPVILDTDIGSDIDDAVCLSYLLSQPRCELVGITTVSGRPKERAALADAVCRAAGRTDVPIHAGIDRAMLGEVVQPDCPQAAVLPKWPHRAPDAFDSYTAVDWLRKTIRQRPGELTLLGIGPMMNIGALFASDPEIPRLLKSLVLMCGCFLEPRAYTSEWNARLDPTATGIVYHANVAEHTSIGLDVTMQCRMPAREAIDRFQRTGGPLSVVAAMTEVWADRAHDVIFHDPLTGVAIFEPGVCEWETGNVTVELLSRTVSGMTHFQATPKPEARHRVAKKVDVKKFFDLYFGVYQKP